MAAQPRMPQCFDIRPEILQKWSILVLKAMVFLAKSWDAPWLRKATYLPCWVFWAQKNECTWSIAVERLLLPPGQSWYSHSSWSYIISKCAQFLWHALSAFTRKAATSVLSSSQVGFETFKDWNHWNVTNSENHQPPSDQPDISGTPSLRSLCTISSFVHSFLAGGSAVGRGIGGY